MTDKEQALKMIESRIDKMQNLMVECIELIYNAGYMIITHYRLYYSFNSIIPSSRRVEEIKEMNDGRLEIEELIKNNVFAKEIWNAAIEKATRQIHDHDYGADGEEIRFKIRKLKV